MWQPYIESATDIQKYSRLSDFNAVKHYINRVWSNVKLHKWNGSFMSSIVCWYIKLYI